MMSHGQYAAGSGSMSGQVAYRNRSAGEAVEEWLRLCPTVDARVTGFWL